MSVRLAKRILNFVFRVGGISEDDGGHADAAVPRSPEELLKRRAIAALRQPHKIVFSHSRQLRWRFNFGIGHRRLPPGGKSRRWRCMFRAATHDLAMQCICSPRPVHVASRPCRSDVTETVLIHPAGLKKTRVSEKTKSPGTARSSWLRIRWDREARQPGRCTDTQSACMLNRLSSPPKEKVSGEELLVGHCDNLLHVRNLIRRIAPADMTVLITGETGTGKELAARAIHSLSPRHNGPFVSVNCAAIPDSLLESELFGFEKGAFTGAAIRQLGKLRSAHRGTIFLDEIGDMSLQTQAKILRTIESQEIQPLGETRNISIDVRVVAATHQNLERLITEQKFRADLYFRLNVLPVYLPPLRERRDDIPEIVDSFIRELNQRYGRSVGGVTKGGLRLLRNQEWPGNVRQLRNVVEGAFLICSSQFITAADLRWLHWSLAKGPHLTAQITSVELPHVPVAPEPDRVLEALQATRWNKSKAAEILRCSRMTVYRRIAKYRLQQDEPIAEPQSSNNGLAQV